MSNSTSDDSGSSFRWSQPAVYIVIWIFSLTAGLIAILVAIFSDDINWWLVGILGGLAIAALFIGAIIFFEDSLYHIENPTLKTVKVTNQIPGGNIYYSGPLIPKNQTTTQTNISDTVDIVNNPQSFKIL